MPAPNYSIFEYRGLKDPVAQEKGHVLKRNNKHYAGRNGEINLFGLHIAVVFDDIVLPDLSGENLNEYGATTTRQASWHVSIDTDTICVSLPDAYTAWVQGVSGYNFNSTGLGAEIATLQTDWRKIPEWRQYRFLRHLAAWWAPRVMKYKNVIQLQRDRNKVQAQLNKNAPAGFAYHGDLDPGNRTDPGLIAGRVDTFPIEWFFELLYDEINIRLGYWGNVYKDTRFTYKPYTYGKRVMQIFCVGEDVGQWQKNLNAAGFKTGVDESFGPDCEAKTLAFQAKHKIIEDGAAGLGTQKVMANVLKGINVPTPDPKPAPDPKPTPKPAVKVPMSRINGSDRFDTNVRLRDQRGKGGARKAYVVNGVDFTLDALVASSLNDGIVFGVRPDRAPSNILADLKKYNPTSIVVVGGTVAITDTVYRQVEDTFR